MTEVNERPHLRSRWSYTTPLLWFACCTFAIGDIMFGYDTGMFGSLQATPSFLNKFGETVNGKRILSKDRQSTMNSLVWIGKGLGALTFEPIMERIGYINVMLLACASQCLGVIIELAGPNWISYSIGRIFCYYTVGLVENAIPLYNAEVSPVPLRAFFTGSYALIVSVGSLWGTLMSRAFATTQKDVGWLVITALQLVPAVALLILLPFVPESPRWLLARDNKEKAHRNLERLRPKNDNASGHTLMELEAIEQAVREAKLVDQTSWLDLFRGGFFRRTAVSGWMFIFSQITGNAFLNSYAATFYKQMGFGDKSFTYATLGAVGGLVSTIPAMLLYDRLGRRPILIVASFVQIPFMAAVGGIGSKSQNTADDVHVIVASVVIFSAAVKIAFNTPSHIIAADLGGISMRKKLMGWGVLWDVLSAFTVTISTPYLLGALGPKVGFVFTAVSAASFLFVLFFVPELKGRSLEEVDELFAMNLWAWQFSTAKTSGVGARITALEGGDSRGIENKTYEMGQADANDEDTKVREELRE